MSKKTTKSKATSKKVADKEQAPTNGESKASNDTQTAVPVFRCLGQAVRDLSLENPVAGWETNEKPQIDMNLGVRVAKREGATSEQGEVWDVTLLMKFDLKGEKRTNCLLELAYSGTYLVNHVPAGQAEALLHVEAPAMLYPFSRHIAMRLLLDAGYQPPLLDPVNFMHLYQQHKQQATAEKAQTAE